MSERINRRSEEIAGETLHLASPDPMSIYEGGAPNHLIYECRLVSCQLQIDDPRGTTLYCSTLVNTGIEVTRTCATSWRGCIFDTCTFKGKYYDCRFGLDSSECSLKASLRNCDFTEAKLNLCTFHNCTPDDLRLPRWPHVTIFNPLQNAAEFADVAKDFVLGRIHQSMCNSSESEVAVTYNMISFVKETRAYLLKDWEAHKRFAMANSEPPPPEPKVSLDLVREFLSKKACVFM